MRDSFYRPWPVGLPGTTRRVVRGGSWNNNADNARVTYRNNNDPNNRNNEIGVRLACVAHILSPFGADWPEQEI